MSICRFATVVAFVLLAAGSSLAQAPSKVSFQGYLTDDSGTPIDGSRAMTFKLYKSGVEVWSEGQTVTVADGLFHVALGRGIPLDTVAFDEPLQLGITIPKDPEMAPRVSLLSAASARALPGLYTFYRDIPLDAAGFNVIGGSESNSVGSDAVASTIGGGGTAGNPNAVDKPGSTVGGGTGNSAVARNATVGGGTDNEASKSASTIAGGSGNEASGDYATVGGGEGNTASGGHAVASGGFNNAASGESAMIPGGLLNEASGDYSFAAGRRAKALHNGAFVWGDDTNADFASTAVDQFLIRAGGGVGIGTNSPGSPLTVNGRIESLSEGFKFPDGTIQTTSAAAITDYWKLGGNAGTSPGPNYIGTSDGAALRIEADGGVGIGTNSPDPNATLHVDGPVRLSDPGLGSKTLLYHGNHPTDTPDVDGFRLRFDAYLFGADKGGLVIEKTDNDGVDPNGGIMFVNRGSDNNSDISMVISGNGNVGIGDDLTPANALEVRDVPSSTVSGNTNAYVSLFHNTSTSTSADGIAVKIGTTGNPGVNANFVGFFDGDTGLIGQIEGNGSGGVSYNTTGADYAELLPEMDPGQTVEAGDVVGVFAGRVSRKTEGADQVLVVTDRPAVLGNMPPSEDEAVGFKATSFIGQVPVKVRGPVNAGDFLIPSGADDGVALAVPPETIQPGQLPLVFATAWESSGDAATKRINAAIGVDQAAAAVRVIQALQTHIETQQLEIDSILRRLKAMETGL